MDYKGWKVATIPLERMVQAQVLDRCGFEGWVVATWNAGELALYAFAEERMAHGCYGERCRTLLGSHVSLYYQGDKVQ